MPSPYTPDPRDNVRRFELWEAQQEKVELSKPAPSDPAGLYRVRWWPKGTDPDRDQPLTESNPDLGRLIDALRRREIPAPPPRREIAAY